MITGCVRLIERAVFFPLTSELRLEFVVAFA